MALMNISSEVFILQIINTTLLAALVGLAAWLIVKLVKSGSKK
jgi:hypothetical protein